MDDFGQDAMIITSSRGVHLRPLLAGLAFGLTICACVVALAALTDEALDRNWGLALLAVMGLSSTLGLVQMVYWRFAALRTDYSVDRAGVRVRTSGGTSQSWTWEQIESVHVRGHFAWYQLVTAQPLDCFPRLEVFQEGRRIVAQPVLLWGGEAAIVDRRISEFARKYS